MNDDGEEVLCPHCGGPLKDDWHGFPACFCQWMGKCPTGAEVCDIAEIDEVLDSIIEGMDSQ